MDPANRVPHLVHGFVTGGRHVAQRVRDSLVRENCLLHPAQRAVVMPPFRQSMHWLR
jgi:hypothetical protein